MRTSELFPAFFGKKHLTSGSFKYILSEYAAQWGQKAGETLTVVGE